MRRPNDSLLTANEQYSRVAVVHRWCPEGDDSILSVFSLAKEPVRQLNSFSELIKVNDASKII